MLYLHNYNPNGFDGSYGSGGGTGCLNAVNLYKANNNIVEDPYGAVGVKTIASLCWKEHDFINISLNQIRSDTISISGDVDVYCFTVPQDGNYRFDSIGNTDVRATINTFVSGVYKQLDINDDYDYPQNIRNFRIYEYLTAGTTVYIDVRGYSSTTGIYHLQITRQTAYIHGVNYTDEQNELLNTTGDAISQGVSFNFLASFKENVV